MGKDYMNIDELIALGNARDTEGLERARSRLAQEVFDGIECPTRREALEDFHNSIVLGLEDGSMTQNDLWGQIHHNANILDAIFPEDKK